MLTTIGKHLLRVALLAAVIFAAMPLAESRAQEDHASLGMARITYLEGDTLFNSPDTEEWAALSPNFTLREGDRLWAGEGSRLEVTFADGHNAWVNDNSELDMTHLSRDQDGNVYQMALATGEASFSVRKPRDGRSVFQVDTANASIRVYRRATFRVTALSDGTTQVGVSRGRVEVETDDGITSVKRGEMVEIDRDGYVDISSLPYDDSWDRWVASRASRYDRPARSARYLPGDMDSYAYEFDEGGRWASVPEYGNVWVPAVAAGWSPYSNGRWVWMANDYVWLSYDPWYAPFHYGRWTWTIRIGWCWVPPLTPIAYWSPGYVGWVWGVDSVCWVPLAPREVYYGYGDYGPHSVNIYKTKVVNITNIYVNSTVNNGVVVVNRDRFVRGETRRIPVTSKAANPFIARERGGFKLIGRPPVNELKPTRETRLPKPDMRPGRQALPPQRLERPPVFIKERSAAKAPAESAFKPGRTPADIRKLNKVNVPPESRRPKEPRIREEKPRREKGPDMEIQPYPPGRDRRMEREKTAPPESTPPTFRGGGKPGRQDEGGAPIRKEKPRREKEPAIETQPVPPERDRRMERERVSPPETTPNLEKGARKPGKKDESATPDTLRRGPSTEGRDREQGDTRRELPPERNIGKERGTEVTPPQRVMPQKRIEGGQTESGTVRQGPGKPSGEPGFRRDKPRAVEPEPKQRKDKEPKTQKEPREQKGDKDSDEDPR